jgi:hypothetical protein
MFCPQCGKEVFEIQAYCQHCGMRLAESAPFSSGGRSRTSWEDRESIGFFTGLSKTLKEVLFTPTSFFRKMPVAGGLTDPLLFAMIVGMTGLLFSYLWDILFYSSMQQYVLPEFRAWSERGMMYDHGFSYFSVLTPFTLIIGLFLTSGFLHLVLLMVRGAKAGFEATFRVVGYGTAPFVVMIIPFCGMPVTWLWVITLSIIGLREAHETSGGKAAVAVLFPFILCCGIITMTMALFMGAVAASFGGMMHWYR